MVAHDEIDGDFNASQSLVMHEVGHALGLGWANNAHLKVALKDAPVDAESTPADLAVRFSTDWNSVDDLPEHGYELYSGNEDPDHMGGADPTPEYIDAERPELYPRWSIMARGSADDTRHFTDTTATQPVVAFSIEELSTTSFDDIPSQEDK